MAKTQDEQKDDQFFYLPSEPTVLVNLFQIRNPDAYSDRYLYLPGSSFRLPGEHALENVDADPILYPYQGLDMESETYVLKGPAFLAWSTAQDQLPGSIQLTEFENVPDVRQAPFGRRLMPIPTSGDRYAQKLPSFRALTSDPGIPGIEPVYEHSATTPRGVKYKYDFSREAHDEWGEGREVFWAFTPEYAGKMLTKQIAGVISEGAAKVLREYTGMLSRLAQQAKSQAPGGGGLTSPESVRQLAETAVPVLRAGGTVEERDLENLRAVLTGKGLPVKAFTTGVGAEASFLLSGMEESGVVWSLRKRRLHDYLTLAGGVGPQAGVSANFSLGFWWGASQQEVLDNMKGFSYFSVGGAGYGAGLSIMLVYTPKWQTYGLNLSLSLGAELQLAVGGLYTWFDPALPQTKGTSGEIRFPEK